jgi:tetrahydromethanopterin S-methyltransferase subunit G
MSTGPIDIEKTNLEAHVDLCAQRYESLDQRLTGIEEKVGELNAAIKDSHNSMVKVIIGTAGTVVAGVLSVLVVILTKMG